jgi:DNA-binding response OmpR family regulator
MALTRPVPGSESAPPRVLFADPDREVRQGAVEALEARQLEVWSVSSVVEAWDLVERRGLPHAAVVELGHPRFDGVGFCERLRRSADLPIVAMSWSPDVAMVVRTLDQHADDYLRKPFAPAELAARVVALLRRVGYFAYTTAAWVRVDDRLAIDFGRRLAVVDDQQVALTPTETKILYLLMRSSGRTVESRFLLARLWPTEEMLEETLRTHVYRLRAKIERASGKARYITTARGLGYRFAPAHSGARSEPDDGETEDPAQDDPALLDP